MIEEERNASRANLNITKGISSEDKDKETLAENMDKIEKEEEDLELVWFQFDGQLQLSVNIVGDKLECSDYSLGNNRADSLHVLECMDTFQVRVDLEYEIIKDELYCDMVDDELLKLRIVIVWIVMKDSKIFQ